MEENRKKIIALGLYNTPGVGAVTLRNLSKITNDPEEILSLGEETLKEYSGRTYLGNLKKHWHENREGIYEQMKVFYSSLEEEGIHFVSCFDKEYPKRLRNIEDYPFALFYKGELPREDMPVVSVIGARECSEYGRKCAEYFGKVLAGEGIQIVSGMARGVDGISQQAALSSGGKSFGILGCGVDICYPKENRNLYESLIQNGGVISEYLPKTEPKASLFPARNRIISAFSDILLVVEARKKSGTYITVCQALEQGREIFAVPGRITDGLSDGCNRLIKDGAGMAVDPEVIVEELLFKGEWKMKKTGAVKRNKEDPSEGTTIVPGEKDSLRNAVLRILDDTPKSPDEILQSMHHFGLDPSYADMLCKLTELALDEKIEEVGGFYKKNTGY